MPFLQLPDVELHYRTIAGRRPGLPWLVFLHEGLGSVDLWRDFPDLVGEATGHPVLVYSREGHGWSTPLTGPRRPDFMHHEALEVLPVVRQRLAIEAPILVGHSDGASIGLIHASRHPVSGIVALAPHVFVEEDSLAGIGAAREAFETSDLPSRMAKYHHDPAGTFHGWHDTWMSPAFRKWNIEAVLPAISAPVLLIQGSDDQYGTGAQLDAIESAVSSPVERRWLEGCGHSPHLDLPYEVTAEVARFIDRLQTSGDTDD